MGRSRRSILNKTMTSKRSRKQRSKVITVGRADDSSPQVKRKRVYSAAEQSLLLVINPGRKEVNDFFSNLSLEIICQILEYLPIWDVVKLECQCRHLHKAVNLHLQLVTDVDFTEGKIHGWMPSGFTDNTLKHFLKRCPELMYIYGLHVEKVSRRRQRGHDGLSIPGMIDALQQCENLAGVETCNIFLLEAILNYLPDVEIMGTFKNRDAAFPIPPQNSISLARGARLTSLHLSGVRLRELLPMFFVKQLHLKWVRFTDPNPFRDFEMPRLRSFVMNNCAGPQSALKYLPLMTGLAMATMLRRLELVRVPFLGGLIYHVVEDSWRVSGFRNLAKFKIGMCKHVQEADLGYLMITSKNKLEELYIQPSLTRDSFFYSLIHANVDFIKLHTLHLGFVDDFPEPGKWTQEELVANGLADYVENPAFMTDFGMKCVAEAFTQLAQLKLYNCPQVHNPTTWLDGRNPGAFSHLTDLHLRRCHAVKLADFCNFISMLPSLEHLYLETMFKEPPKGCSRVGLSAGLGVSSAFVSGDHSAGNENLLNPLANQHVSVQQPANRNPPNNAVIGDDSDSEEERPLEPKASFDVHNEDMEVDGQVSAQSGKGKALAPNGMGSPSQGPSSCERDSLSHRGEEASTSQCHSGTSGKDGSEMECCEMQATQGAAGSSVCSDQLQEGCVEVDGYVWNNIGEIDEPEACSDDEGMEDAECPGIDAMRATTSERDTSEMNVDGSGVSVQESCAKCDRPNTGNKCDTNNSGSLPGGNDADISTMDTMSVEESSSSQSSSNSGGSSCEGSNVPYDNGEPCSSKEPLHDQMSSLSVSRPSSKGKLLKNRSMACYPKGKSSSSRGVPSADDGKGFVDSGSVSAMEGKESADSQEVGAEEGGGNGTDKTVDSVDKKSPAGALDDENHVGDWAVMHDVKKEEQEVERPVKDRMTECEAKSDGSATRQDKHSDDLHQSGARCSHDKNRTASCEQEHQIEDDHPQVLVIQSNSLLSLNLRCVGITDLIIKSCKKISSLTVSGCRVLKNVRVDEVPVLSRVSFVQCPKLRHEEVVDELCRLPPNEHRLIYLRPIKNYDAARLEQQLLSSPAYAYHVCLIHDHSLDPEETLYNRMRVASWPDIITRINYDLIRVQKQPEVTKDTEMISDQYPWRQGVYRMQGKSVNGSDWDLVSDIPWIETLASDEDRINQSWLYSDSKAGVYSPSAKGHCSVVSAQRRVQEKIQEIRRLNRPLHLQPAIVYVNLCDLNGIVPDKYA